VEKRLNDGGLDLQVGDAGGSWHEVESKPARAAPEHAASTHDDLA